MDKKFSVEFLEEALAFVESLDKKTREKIYYNARKAQITNDSELFKKLNGTIWEFRTKYNKNYYRILAFWDKTDNKDVLVIASNGFVKKTSKIPKNEIIRAEQIRDEYFKLKSNENEDR